MNKSKSMLPVCLRDSGKFAFLMAAFLVTQSAFCEAQQETDVDILSIANCGRLNVLGIRSADVLIHRDKVFDTSVPGEPKGLLSRDSLTVRVLFDEDNGRFASYMQTSSSLLDLVVSADPVENASFGGFCYDGKSKEYTMRLLGHTFSQKRKSATVRAYDFLKSARFMDPRGLVAGNPRVLSPIDIEAISSQEEFGPSENSSQLVSAKRVGEHIRVVRKNKHLQRAGYSMVIIEKYSSESLMLVSQVFWLENNENKKRTMKLKRRFRWEDKDGVQLLTKLFAEQETAVGVNGRREVGIRETTYSLDWLSLNEDIPLDQFSQENLASDREIDAKLIAAKDSIESRSLQKNSNLKD